MNLIDNQENKKFTEKEKKEFKILREKAKQILEKKSDINKYNNIIKKYIYLHRQRKNIMKNKAFIDYN
jgi:hypothetical protein